MKYINLMRNTRPDLNNIFSGTVFVSTKRGIPFLPGALLITLGIVVLLAPRFVLGAIAFCLLALGALLCYAAYKIIMLRRQINSLAKNFEGSLYGSLRGSGSGSSAFGSQPDIDISDFANGGESSKKIIVH
jgi:hypothetical protein